eukprot:symbB.v1.2.033265.t1/scaffold4109.1/size44509/2
MTHGVLCWTDTWVYKECCDVQRYGASGLDLCFSQGYLSFEGCCPHPLLRKRPEEGEQVQVLEGPWQDQHPGCDAKFPWAPHALTPALLHGPSYHPHTGELMQDVLPATFVRWSKAAGQIEDPEDQREARKLRVRQELNKRWETLGFRSVWDVEMAAMLTQVISNFAFSLQECAPVVLLAGLLKAECLFDLDLPLARRVTRNLRQLMQSAENYGRMTWTSQIASPSWRDILSAATQRIDHLEGSRKVPARPWVVDMVFPLCSPKEILAVNEGLQLLGRSIPQKLDPTEGWASGTIRARQAMDHLRLRGSWRHARFRVFVYMVCGTYALLGHDTDRDEDLSQSDVEKLSKRLFSGLSEELLKIFGGGLQGKFSLPHVHLAILEEEVPTGDAAVYLHHLAKAAASETLGNITLLLHPDFLEHVRSWRVSSIFQALVSGSWPKDVDFMYLGWRHEGPVTDDGRVASHMRYHCDLEPSKKGGNRLGPCDGGYNPILLQNLWLRAFGRDLDPIQGDDLGGYDFSQLLVTRRAVLHRPVAYWRYLSQVISARSSFELLPGTKFISRRTDLTVNDPWNKGVCAWFEHIWHMLFDPSFFPDGNDDKEPDLRYFTSLHDKRLPLGLRSGPDTVMGRHYWFSAEEQCNALRDEQGCRIWQMQQDGRRQTVKPTASMQPQ